MNRKINSHIGHIEISGFKSIKKSNVDLRNINVLIGGNGAGKSNFLSVFSMLQHVLERELALYIGKSGMNSIFYNGIKETDKLTINVRFNNSSNCFYAFELEPTKINSVIFAAEELGYYQTHNHIEQKTSSVSSGHTEALWKQSTEGEASKLLTPVLEELQLRVYHFSDTGKNAKLKVEHRISNNKVLHYDAANLASFLYRLRNNHPKAYQDVLEAVQLIAPFFKDFELEPEEQNDELIILRWRQKGCEDIFNASQLSDGTLRFVCLATLLLQPEELQPSIIIIDEPELGLHPFAITIFSELVKKVAIKKQIILSTQSVELLDQFETEDIIVVDCGDDGSDFKRLRAEELTDWIENDYTLGELWQKNILGGRLSK